MLEAMSRRCINKMQSLSALVVMYGRVVMDACGGQAALRAKQHHHHRIKHV